MFPHDKRTDACSECRQLQTHEAIEVMIFFFQYKREYISDIISISASKSVGTTSQDISIKDLLLCGCLIMSPAALLLDPYPPIIRV